MFTYSPEIEKQKHAMYDRLSEKDKRLYAGVEALKLPYGGVSYIAELFGCSRNTVMRGIIELGGQETIPRNRDRMAGGGRKQVVEIKDKDKDKDKGDIDEIFLSILKEHTILWMKRSNGLIRPRRIERHCWLKKALKSVAIVLKNG